MARSIPTQINKSTSLSPTTKEIKKRISARQFVRRAHQRRRNPNTALGHEGEGDDGGEGEGGGES